MSDISLYDAIHSQRAIRHLKPDPVGDDLIRQLIEAATRAPSARNEQPWRFIVVRDRDTKAKLGTIFDELGQQMVGHAAPDHTPWGEVPVLIAVCSEGKYGEGPRGERTMDASVYPAVQNLLLTARALGLGTVLTTRWQQRIDEVRPLLGLPEGVTMHAIVPVGWPAAKFGRTTRRPPEEVTFNERYGTPWSAGN